MSTRLYLVRHGETHWNALKKFQGHSDIPLSSVGQRQAQELAHHIKKKDIKFDGVYCSDLIRAVKTAKILLGHTGYTLKKAKRLREINFGVWEGYTIEQIQSQYRELLGQWYQDPFTVTIPHGENLSDVAQRAGTQIIEIVKKHVEQDVLLVTHGGVIRVIVCKILGINMNQFWRLRIDNCSLTVLNFPDGDITNGILELFNFTS